MTTPIVITANLPQVPVGTLAEGAVEQYLPVAEAERIARYGSDGVLEGAISLTMGWVYPGFGGEGALQVYAGGPIIPIVVDFHGEGYLQTEEMTIPKVFSSFGGEGTATAAVAIGKKSFTDDFNRANGPVGSNYMPAINGEPLPAIVNGVAQSPIASGTALVPAVYRDAMTTDNMSANMIIANPSNTAQSELFIRASTSGSSWGTNQTRPSTSVMAQIRTSALALVTMVNGTATTRATKSGLSLTAGDLVEVRASGSTLRVFLNGAEQLVWSDPGGESLSGPDYRHCGFTTIYSSNTHMTRFDAFACADL